MTDQLRPIIVQNYTMSVKEMLKEITNSLPCFKDNELFELREALKERFPHEYVTRASPGDSTLDLMSEVQAQLSLLRELRTSMQRDTTASPAEKAKMITSSNSLLSMLQKFQKEVSEQERWRKIEIATVKALEVAGDKVKDKFFKELDKLLDAD